MSSPARALRSRDPRTERRAGGPIRDCETAHVLAPRAPPRHGGRRRVFTEGRRPGIRTGFRANGLAWRPLARAEAREARRLPDLATRHLSRSHLAAPTARASRPRQTRSIVVDDADGVADVAAGAPARIDGRALGGATSVARRRAGVPARGPTARGVRGAGGCLASAPPIPKAIAGLRGRGPLCGLRSGRGAFDGPAHGREGFRSPSGSTFRTARFRTGFRGHESIEPRPGLGGTFWKLPGGDAPRWDARDAAEIRARARHSPGPPWDVAWHLLQGDLLPSTHFLARSVADPARAEPSPTVPVATENETRSMRVTTAKVCSRFPPTYFRGRHVRAAAAFDVH